MGSVDSRERLFALPAEVQFALLASLVDSFGDAVIVHEPGGQIVFHNERATQLLGFTADQMLDMHPFGWVSPDAIKGAPDRLETILHEGHMAFRSRAKHWSGREIPTEVHARRVDVEAGPLIVAVIRSLSPATDAEPTGAAESDLSRGIL